MFVNIGGTNAALRASPRSAIFKKNGALRVGCGRVVAVIVLAIVLLGGCASYRGAVAPDRPPHHGAQGFRNWPPIDEPDASEIAADWARLAVTTRRRTPPPGFALPLAEARAGWDALGGADAIMWIGHATMLIRVAGVTVLTDPVFAESMTPLPPFGPLRVVPPGLPIDSLPRIDAIVVSHNHYDHYEPDAIRRIAARDRPLCLVPLRVRPEHDLGCERFAALDWGESATRGAVTLRFLPAQHESGRSMFDRNRTLWGSWLIEGSGRKVYFAGDTGFGPHFASIAAQYGPIDLAILPVAAHLPRNPNALLHIGPDDAIRAFVALGARRMVAMHWGTYALGTDGVFAALTEIPRAARAAAIAPDRVWLMRIGETRRL